MGIFSNLKDAFSGKNYKRNELVIKKIVKLLEKNQEFSGNELVKHCTYSCILSVDIDLEGILFREEGSDINIFKKNIDLLNEEKTFEFMKLLVGRYLTSFKRNKDFKQIIKIYNIKTQALEDEIFSFFSFTRENEKDFYELDSIFEENIAKYFRILTEKIFKNAYGIKKDLNNPIDSLFLQTMTSNTYNNVFIENLSKEINN
ncbi:MAG: hypothetical protein ACOX0B_01230 [Minisyncoccales bacterium]